MTTAIADDISRGNADPTDAARAEVARLLEVELTLASKRDLAEAGLPGLEASAGDLVLDGADVGRLASEISTARAEVSTLDAAIDAARARRVEAIEAVFAAEADELRAQAAAKRAEAERRRGKTDLLLIQLEQHEGVPYGPLAPDRPARLDPTGQVGGEIQVIGRPIPRTAWLLVEAEDLDRRAAAERAVTQHGRVDAGSVDELLAAATADPMHIGPTISSVRPWAAGQVAGIEAQIARAQARFGAGSREAAAQGEGRPIRFDLYWGRGVIDVASSRAEPVMPEPTPVMTRHGGRYDRHDGAGPDPAR